MTEQHEEEAPRRGPRHGGMSRRHAREYNASKRIKKAYHAMWTIKSGKKPRTAKAGAPSLKNFARTSNTDGGQKWLENKTH